MIVSVNQLSVKYQQSTVLDNISFDLEAGEYLGIVGPNGSGKSTLVKALLGLVEKSNGEIKLFDQRLDGFNQWARIGYLPQSTSIPTHRFPAKVAEIVATGLICRKQFPRWITRADMESVRDTLELLGISGLKDKFIGRLSGGQRQRVLLARALVSRPELLVLDEPILALDPIARNQFYEITTRLHRQQGTTIMLISHDSTTIGEYATKLLYLDRKLVYYGSFDEFCQSDNMTQYFGEFQQHLICHQHDGNVTQHR